MIIRTATEADSPRLLTVASLTNLTPLTMPDFSAQMARAATHGPVACKAAELEGYIVGYGTLFRSPLLPADGFNVTVKVDPSYSRQGVGSALLRALEEQAVDWGGTTLEANVRDDRQDWATFALARGYTIKEHFLNWELDLTAFDPEPFRPMLARAETNGYRFLTMADFSADMAERRLYELDMELSKDEPDKGPDWEPINLEEFRAEVLTPDCWDPKAVFVAEKEGEWAGVSGCEFPPGQQSASVYFTGVRRTHRGHGLAQALKLLACEYVRSRGDRSRIETSIHFRNLPMLALNRKFGFVPTPGTLVLRKTL